MTNSAQNPDSPNNDNAAKPALKRFIRKPAPPPGDAAPADEHTCDVLVHGDPTQRFLQIRAQAHLCAGNPSAFLGVFADFLSSEAMGFERYTRARAVAASLQISDDYQAHSDKYENIDDNARQYLGYHKLFSDPAYRAFMSDVDRTFRRASQSHKTILQASRLAKR